MNNKVGVFKIAIFKVGFTLLIVLILSFFSGWSEVGIDRENYINAVHLIRSVDLLSEKIFFAKDINFLLITNFASLFSNEVKLVFLILCFIAITSKYYAVKKLAKNHLFSFIFLYAIFLAPGLEFVAMRSALAIGFLFQALAFRGRIWLFTIFSILSISSHISLLPIILLAIPKINGFLLSHKFGYYFLTVLIAVFGGIVIALSPQGSLYGDNQGTIYAYALPLMTLIIALMVFYRSNDFIENKLKNSISENLLQFKPIIFGLISIALGITHTVVVASTRYLEISWCLLLLISLTTYKRSIINFAGMIALLILLTYINFVRFTWTSILNF